jgi:2-polyprenyl-3-methyl-5-hydroxy-6-metoxy-1,4-benzoquinol methylase
MANPTETIKWSEYLSKYTISTVLKDSLLKPYFKHLSLEEPIVDLGCGTGYFSDIITNAGKKVLGIDKNGNLPTTDRFTFMKEDIVDFHTETKFNSILLINILSVESVVRRNALIGKIQEIIAGDGMAYILTTSSKLFNSPTESEFIRFIRLAGNKAHLIVKLVNGDYIEFDDFIVPEEETRRQIIENGLEIVEEKEFQHPEMDRPVYVLYIVKKRQEQK